MFSKFRSRIVWRCKTNIAAPAPTTFGHYNLLPVTDQISQHFSGIIINNNCARRNANDHIFGISAMLTFIAPFYTTLSFKVPLVPKIHKCTQTFIYSKNNVSTLPAISTGRPSFRNVFLPAECDDTVSSVSSFYINLRFIYKHAFTSF
ncbi:hypothetical protein D1872_256550 [compost metagenome]